MFKTLVKKFLESKLASFAMTALSGWRIWLLVSSIVGGYIMLNKHKLSKANTQINTLTARLLIADASNGAYQLMLDVLSEANKQCARKNQANEELTTQVTTQLTKDINQINSDYAKLKDKKNISECGNALVDDGVL